MRSGRFKEHVNIWPGFVDALSALLLVMLFALIVFVVSQAYLSEALVHKERSLSDVQQAIYALNKALGLEKKRRISLEKKVNTYEAEEKKIKQSLAQEAQKKHQHIQEINMLKKDLQELNAHLSHLQQALQSVTVSHEEKKIEVATLNAKLQKILEKQVKELGAYRSEFFGKLRQALGKRDDVRVVGDRFVFQSEVLFEMGSNQLGPTGQEKLAKLARSLKEIALKIPPEISWVLRVDGHTDTLPIHTTQFPSNWELSAARAISVVQFLIQQGIPPEHLAAAGFGQFQPLDKDTTAAGLARNRRIELKLDQR